jgi:hypothetical protein
LAESLWLFSYWEALRLLVGSGGQIGMEGES